MQQRITEVQHYLAGRHGSIGIVLEDRVSGAVWHNGRAHRLYPAASTMKLAVLTDLLLRSRRGRIHLTAADWREMYQALHTSNDTDANDLWRKYENASFLARIRAFGMAQAQFEGMINWGYMYCSAKDLDHLMNYVLTKTPASVGNYLVRQLRQVSVHDQQWGVWAPARRTSRATRTAGSRIVSRPATPGGSRIPWGSPAPPRSTRWPSWTTSTTTAEPARGDSSTARTR
jgi:hypothetical protein